MKEPNSEMGGPVSEFAKAPIRLIEAPGLGFLQSRSFLVSAHPEIEL